MVGERLGEEEDAEEEVDIEGVGADGSVSKCSTTTVTQEVVELVDKVGSTEGPHRDMYCQVVTQQWLVPMTQLPRFTMYTCTLHRVSTWEIKLH